MLSKLEQAQDRYREIEQNLTLPQIVSDGAKYAALMKEYKQLTPIVETYREYRAAEAAMCEAEELLGNADAEIRELAQDEWRENKARCGMLEEKLRFLLIPRDPNDDRDIVVEIRQGAGGEEAALFAAVLFRMYSMYATARGFRVCVVHENETELGGYKEIVFSVKGEGAYSRFKFESGVHRVQRVPITESNGRIQTSTVTVAVLPEAQEVEITIDPADIRMETCKSSGAGGQHINKTESAVRLIHKPSGMVVECDQERSQLQNRETAMQLLRTRLYAIKVREQEEAIASARKSQVGTGERSEKIRTYNYQESRVTDHRIKKTVYTLESFLNGNMDEILDELIAVETVERLKGETV